MSAGDYKTGPHASAYACDMHRDAVETWVFSQTHLMPNVEPVDLRRLIQEILAL